MPVDYVPGFWDSLGAATEKGIDRYREDNKFTQQQNLLKGQFLQGLFDKGSIDASTLESGLRELGVSGRPSSTERPAPTTGAPPLRATMDTGVRPAAGGPPGPGTAMPTPPPGGMPSSSAGRPGSTPGVTLPTESTGGTSVVKPNIAERRRKALAGGEEAIAKLGNEERRELGFQTNAQKKAEQATMSADELSLAKNTALLKYAQTGELDPNMEALTGIHSAAGVELERVAKLDPLLASLGGRFVAGEMIKLGGRLPTSKEGAIDGEAAMGIAQRAYQAYVQQRSAVGLGDMTPEEQQYAESYFTQAVQEAIIGQFKLDIAMKDAESRRIGANAQAAQRVSIQWFGKMNQALEGVRKQKADLLRNTPGLSNAIDNPALARSPFLRAQLERYMLLERMEGAFRNGQSEIAVGNIPGDLSSLLDQAGDVLSGNFSTAAPSGGAAPAAPTAARPPAAGQPVTRPAVRPAATQTPGPKAPQGVRIKVVNTAVDRIIRGDAKTSDIDDAVNKGIFSKEEGAMIKQRLANTGRGS